MNRSRLSDEIYLAWYLLTTSPFSHAPTEALEAIRKQWPDVNQDTTVKVVSVNNQYFVAPEKRLGWEMETRAALDNLPSRTESSPVVSVRFVDLVFKAAYVEGANRLYIREFED